MAFITKIKSQIMSRRALFSALAILMLVGLGVFVVYEVTFIATNLNTAISPGSGNTAVEKFDIKGFEALKLQQP